MRTRHTGLFALLLLAVFVCSASGQTVVQRSILGSHVEGLTFIDKGPMANSIVVIDAFEVNALSTQKNGAWQHLFTLTSNDFSICPRGIAFDSKSKLLIFDDSRRPNQLFYYDLNGKLVKTRTFTYPASYTPDHVEGLAYLPKSSPYPDHVAILADVLGYPAENRIEIIGPGNTVVKEIIPMVPIPEEQLLTGIAYQEDTGLFVVSTGNDNTFWTIDFTGAVVGTYSGPDANLEGIAFAKSGDMIVMPLGGHQASFYDAAMNRLPAKDREYRRGVGIDPPFALVWDSDQMQYLVSGGVHYEVNAIDMGVTKSTMLFDPLTLGWDYYYGMAYVPGERVVAMANSGQRQIGLVTLSGALVQTISTSPYMPGSYITYVASRDAFATRRANQLHQWGRNGAPILTVDLSTVGLTSVNGMTYALTASGERFVITGRDANNAAWIVVTDVNFVPIARYSSNSVPVHLTYISNGPNAGMYAGVDSDRNELVVFQIP